MEKSNLQTVAIIGRPNVGKSSLFNRLIGKRVAIESPVPGTTRDRLVGEVEWAGRSFQLVDVAGIEKGNKKELNASMQEGVNLAIDIADLILFVVDWNEKDDQRDKDIARMLKKSGKKVIMAVNKADNLERQLSIEEFKRFGFEHLVPVSAISGKSSGDLLDEVMKDLDKKKIHRKEIRADIKLSIIGRPNAGKSTLLNSIIGEKRAIVSGEAGTTRDIISVIFSHKGKQIMIADTAGLRRPGKIVKDTVESFSTLRTYNALKDCDVAVVMIDAVEGLVALDANILGQAKEWGKGIVLAVNKIDLVSGDRDEYMAKMLYELQTKLNFVPWLPVVFISAQDEENINSLLSQVVVAADNRKTLIPDEDLLAILTEAKNSNFQLAGIKSLVQEKTNPPVFKIKYSGKIPHTSQIRYIENRIRDRYPMSGTPVFLDLFTASKKRA